MKVFQFVFLTLEFANCINVSQHPVLSQSMSDPVYGSNGETYWYGHSANHISQEAKFNRYLDTLKPVQYEDDEENTKATLDSLKWAEKDLGEKME